MTDNELEPWQRFQRDYGQGYYWKQQPGSGPSMKTSKDGWERWQTNVEPDGAGSVSVHSLLAIACGYDPHKVYSNGKWHVHHKNGIPWDNRPENLELKRVEDHARHHSVERVKKGTHNLLRENRGDEQ